MVDVKQVIKKMREDGMTREQIIDSLKEIGFASPEQLVDRALAETPSPLALAPPAPTRGAPPSPPALPAPSEKKESLKELTLGELPAPEEKPAEEKAAKVAGGGKAEGEAEGGAEGHALFEEIKAPAEKEEEKEEEAEALESLKPSELKITQITEEGEKEVSIEDMLEKAGVAKGGVEQPSKQELSSFKEKLDETIALLRALQEINKKILETDREVLLRLKSAS